MQFTFLTLEKFHPDVLHDLNKYPYPFKDNSADEVLCQYIFEHVKDRFAFLNELLRICKNGAIVNIEIPHWSHFLTWSDLQHTGGFSSMAFDFYQERYTDRNSPYFIVVKKELISYTHGGKGILGRFNNWIVNLHHIFTELILCKFIPVQAVRFKSKNSTSLGLVVLP